jgi:predicted GIY-YIG superfamily endonuclease
MIQGMKRRGRKDWTVYILRCGDGSLYTGIAKDVRARVKQHSEGRGATYTRTRLPVKLLYQQEGLTRSKALIREAQIKAMPRSKKEEIIFRGSHRQYKHPTIPGRVTIAGHPNDDLAPGTLNSILKQAKLKEVK